MNRRAPTTNGQGDSPDLLQIGEAADRVGLSIRTLRHWEEVDLVTPTARSKGGFRLYSHADLRRLTAAKIMKPMGLTLGEMRTLLALIEEATIAGGERRRNGAAVAERLEQFARRTVERIELIEQDHRDASILLERIQAFVALARRSEAAAKPSVSTRAAR
jgi:MerR family transcriptional regulator, copper efflux regulator